MPYRDKEQQRAVQREGARRRRAAKREAGRVADEPVIAPCVAPTVAPVEPAVTAADLVLAGHVLHHPKGVYELDEAYRARLRAVWRALLRVVE